MATFKTKDAAISALVATADKELGYLEKRTNSSLMYKTKNAGSNNYTKYGKSQGCNGQPWCDAFVDWCFKKTFGKDNASKLIGGYSNYTPDSAARYKKQDNWSHTPHKGDQIFFKNSQRICHTGIVVKVTDDYVYTIEGNTDGGGRVVANGGGVYKKKYAKNNGKIAGYGHPDYSKVVKESKKKTK